ncbi:hypothetical protein L208DRAFT_1422280 [Tricholoma matsutake]|nr:hypothetical protein L208DRAFT_1422280 [Tricholoma matsutake 945]
MSAQQKIQGFSTSVGTEYLAAYATIEWLNNEHMTHMLDLLRCDVIWQGLSQRVEKYTSHRSYRWICGQGQALGMGAHKQLVSIRNVGKNHWIALVMDFTQGTVFYGDSLGKKISDNLHEVLDWWTHLHTGNLFDYCDLPITYQQDNYSCGLLAWNALAVFLLEGMHTLVDPSCVAQECLKVLLQFCFFCRLAGGVLVIH